MKVELSYNIYRPQDYALGIVQIIHGMSEYGQRYEKFAQYLCKKGFVVITYDHRGHGTTCLSKDEFGYFDAEDGWLKLIEDAHFITDVVKKEYPPTVPFILFGHSMGSLIARSYLKRFDYELDGLICSGAPNYRSATPFGIFLAKLLVKLKGEKAKSKLLEDLSTGQFDKKFQEGTKYGWISKNSENVESYINDPLCGFPFTNKGYEDLFRLLKDMHSVSGWNCTNAQCPIFFIAGEDDPCTGGKKGLLNSINRLKKAGYTNVTQHEYPDLRHEILNEKQQELIYEDIFEWISRHCLKKNG